MTQDIFISYRRHDAAFFAAKLRDRIEQTFPGQVFLDVSGIEAGEDFIDKLRSTVAAAKVVIAVISPGWRQSRGGATRLGEAGDFVTEELAGALASGTATIPVLIEGAQMPQAQELPERLQALPRRNAVSISHERFDSDANLLIAQLYRPLGLTPPGRLERLLELAGGARAAANQRSRDQFALFSLAAAAFAALLTALWIVIDRADPLEAMTPLAVIGLALLLGWIGRNSARRRRAATAALAVSALLLVAVAGLSLWRGMTLPRDAWIQANLTAQAHFGESALPAERVAWSTRVPFYTPPPTVPCECLTVQRPDGPRPYAAGAAAAFRNACSGPVQFVLSRSTSAQLAGAYPWFAGSGREFAVITLSPGQAVQIALEGTYGGAMLPWVCAGAQPGTPPAD